MEDHQQEWTLAELAAATGLSARTIRFYIARNLVPGPLKSGRGATYGEVHAAALNRIKQLQANGLALADIARELSGETNPNVLPSASPWWQYGLTDDVTVWVRADASPWRLKQIRMALAELASRLEKKEEQGGSDE